MTFATMLLILAIVLFTANLLFLIVYLGPILTEVRMILGDVRGITAVAESRVEKIDSALDSASSFMGFAKSASKVGGKVYNWQKKRKKKKDEEEED